MPSPSSATTSAPSPSARKCQVLIIEDDLTSARALRSILTRKNCNVRIASTVQHALMMLAQRLPDHIILDLLLPDGDGADVLRWLREHRSSTPVTVTTSTGDADKLREIRELHPRCILRKPIDLVDLLAAIGMM